ncbi:MAG: DUF2291 family protein [Novosphingobium sp.]|uniref:DUF2291 family protein n=1 Tax=Novosphingobium sp. TaxID=1874826 RepID=UPI003B9CBDFA
MSFGIAGKARFAVAATLLVLTSACKIVSIDEDRAMRERRSGKIDAGAVVARDWQGRLLPELTKSAVNLAEIWPAIARDPAAAGAAHGRQASEGANWTFVVKGQGRVVSVDDTSRSGAVRLAVPGVGDVAIQTGPVLVSTAVRDAIPSLRFDDFPDQMAFAAVNKALNAKALESATRNRALLREGAEVSFVGVMHMGEPGQAAVIVPVALGAAAQGG